MKRSRYWHPLPERDLTTINVPLGSPYVSLTTGRVYRSSDLGFVDAPDDYDPDQTPRPWEVDHDGSGSAS